MASRDKSEDRAVIVDVVKVQLQEREGDTRRPLAAMIAAAAEIVTADVASLAVGHGQIHQTDS